MPLPGGNANGKGLVPVPVGSKRFAQRCVLSQNYVTHCQHWEQVPALPGQTYYHPPGGENPQVHEQGTNLPHSPAEQDITSQPSAEDINPSSSQSQDQPVQDQPVQDQSQDSPVE